MSLVNDMLNDLETRGDSHGDQAVTPTGESRRSGLSSALSIGVGLSALAVVTVVFAGQWFEDDRSEPVQESATKPAMGEESTQPAVTGQVNTDSTQGSSASTSSSDPATDRLLALAKIPPATGSSQPRATDDSSSVNDNKTTADAGDEETIQRLLSRAEQALQRDRLTVPFNDNAYHYYQSILLLQPEHAGALSGIDDIVSRYLELYQAARLEQQKQATRYRRKARQVAAPYPEVRQRLEQRLADLPSPTPAENTEEPATATTETNSDDKASATEESQQAIADDKAAADQPRIRVAASRRAQDRNQARAARQLLREGKAGQAAQLLEAYLADHPEAPNSREQLFNIYLQTGDLAAADSQLQQMSGLADHQRALKQARLLIQHNLLDQARDKLNEYSPAYTQAPDYYSVLAALCHKQGDYQTAVQHYRALLRVNSQQPTYWLGLAVSLDAMADRGAALRAFRQAKHYGAGDGQTQAYIDQRIASLSG